MKWPWRARGLCFLLAAPPKLGVRQPPLPFPAVFSLSRCGTNLPEVFELAYRSTVSDASGFPARSNPMRGIVSPKSACALSFFIEVLLMAVL